MLNDSHLMIARVVTLSMLTRCNAVSVLVHTTFAKLL